VSLREAVFNRLAATPAPTKGWWTERESDPECNSAKRAITNLDASSEGRETT
jgi:hypothetical protein